MQLWGKKKKKKKKKKERRLVIYSHKEREKLAKLRQTSRGTFGTTLAKA
jgi:hypothetical protein